MRITLIQPPKNDPKVEADGHWALTRPFSLFYLASYLKTKTPHDVTITDFEHPRFGQCQPEEILRSGGADVFGITAATSTRFEAIRIARLAKRLSRESVVVVGGVHFMYCAEDTLEHVPEIDIVVRGEGEMTLVELVDAIDQGRSLESVNGITYRRNGQVIQNPPREVFEDLDNIPVYTDFTWEEYPEFLFGTTEKVRALSVMSSRGCPYKCIFCSKAGMKYRLRKPKNVVDEIEQLKNRFGIEGINFLDLTFTANPNHATTVCEELMHRQLNLSWWCESRANIPLDLLPLMRKAGCTSLVVGVESGSARILSNISKGISPEQVVRFCRECVNAGIQVQPYFMFSHVDETIKDAQQTLDLIDRLEEFTLSCSFQPSMIFPGTELERIAREKGILPRDFSWCTPFESKLNERVGQLVNIPLFIDRLTENDLVALTEERRRNLVAAAASKLSLKDAALKFVDHVKRGKNPLKYLASPKFLLKYTKGRFKSLREKSSPPYAEVE